MRQAVHWIIIAIAAAAPAAHAQVFKCKDAQGRVMYSDTGCASLQQGHLIERERSMEEKHRERAQAYRAQQDKQERQLREREREMRAEEDRVMRAAAEPEAPAAPRHKGYAERLQERNDGVRSVFAPPKLSASRNNGQRSAGNTTDTTPSPPPPPSPSVITHCAGGFCYDNMGGVYHRHGNGTTMTGPSGGTCIQTGSMVNCP